MATIKILFRQLSLLILIFFLSFRMILAQSPSEPQTIGELKFLLEDEMKKQHIAGMMLVVIEKDSILQAGGLGLADVENKIPVNEKHLFRQASITKLFVALGVLNLVKEGKITVNSKLKEIAPELIFRNQWETTDPVTIAHLLEHTTGFSDKSPFEEYNFSGQNLGGLEALKIFDKFLESRWKPGERHAYSGVNYAVLAYIIEKISGMPLNDYLRTKVFSPLGMPNANVSLTSDISEQYAKGYVWKNNGFQPVPHQPQYNAGYGSLNASAQDLANALKAYLNNWKTPNGQFLTEAILNDSEMPHTYLSAKDGLKNTYAYGNMSTEVNSVFFRGHSGAIGGFLSNFQYNRTEKSGYALSINTFNEPFFFWADGIVQRFLSRSIAKSAPPKEFAINKDAIEPYLGYYRFQTPSQLYSGFFERYQRTFKLEEQNDKLEAKILLGGQMTWASADNMKLWFRDIHASHPHIAFLKDNDGNLIITDQTMSFKKISALEAWLPIILFIASALFILSSLVTGLIWLIMFLFHKINKSEILLRLSPGVAAMGLLIIVFTIPALFEHMQECTSMNKALIGWNTGKYVFAVFTFISLLSLIFRWKYMHSKSLKMYLIIVVLADLYLLGLLMFNHWYW